MASQVHPDLIDKLPEGRTFLFQANLDQGSQEICNELLGDLYKDWFPVTGGSTVFLRALPALKMLGYRDFEVYGADSCWGSGKHHAFDQPENDVDRENAGIVANATIEGREFSVEPWMLAQAHEYIIIRQRVLPDLKINIHGDGLIAWCIETGIDYIDELEE